MDHFFPTRRREPGEKRWQTNWMLGCARYPHTPAPLSRPAAWAGPEARSLRLAIRCQLRWAQMATSAETLLAESATVLVAEEAKPAAAPRVWPKPLALLLAPSRRSQSRSDSKLEWW